MKLYKAAVPLFLLFASCCQAQLAGSTPVIHEQNPESIDDAQLHTLLTAERPPLTFHADDVIALQIYGVETYKTPIEQTIATDGSLVLPLIGTVSAAGLTSQQLTDLISSRLIASGTILTPQISIVVLKRPSAIVTVSGNVLKPGAFPAAGDLTILDYLSQAGAFSDVNLTQTAVPASTTVTLVRPSLPAPVTIPLGPDPRKSEYGRIPAFPGDQILVGKVGMVYAVGAFRTQGGYTLKSTTPTTITQLVALAGGVGFEADLGDAHVVRTVGHNRVLLPVKVKRILEGKDPDIALTSDDILFVPTNRLKAAIKGGGSGLIVSLATAALYTH